MLSVVARRVACPTARQSSVRAFSSLQPEKVESTFFYPGLTVGPDHKEKQVLSPWGTDHWRHDKKAFIRWCKEAILEDSKARRELYGFAALNFGDVDTDKDGFINQGQFDRYLESVAAIPRRFGLAPVSSVDRSTRLANHTVIFDQIDAKDGPARGKLGLDQVLRWTIDHVAGKIAHIPEGDVGLYHVEDYSEAEYVGFIERAVNKPGSYEHVSFYNFILNVFIEADTQCEGRVTYDQFGQLLSRAASVPRHFGLAPADVDESVRKAMFKAMELKRDGVPQGFVTHRKFWEWTVEHTKMKIDLQKAGKGWRENH
jgi:hypothetical protein